MNKYHNKKVIIDGLKFDSIKESKYYLYFKNQEKKGNISHLKTQVKFELQPAFKIENKKIRPIYYIADFTYIENGIKKVIDVKGVRTEVYKIKKKLFEYKYQMEIKEL